MKSLKKVAAAILALSMIVGLMACGKAEVDTTAAVETTTKAEETTKTEETTKADVEKPSEEITLVLYQLGNEPADMSKVLEKVNEILLAKFNVKLEVNFSTWTDYGTKYANTLVTAGADMVYVAAGWLKYKQYAAKGAYVEMDELLPTYAPELYEFVGEDRLNQVKVDGHIYAVPSMWDEYTLGGIAYRKDLCEKYDIPEPIENIKNLEAYFNKLASLPQEETGLSKMFEATGATESVSTLTCTPSALLVYNWDNKPYDSLSYGYLYNADDPSHPLDYYYSDQFVDDMKKLKEWCDNGWWSRSILSDEADTTAIQEGTAAATVSGANGNKWRGWKTALGKLDDFTEDDLGWWEYANMNGNFYPSHTINNGTAILPNCKYPEIAMQVIQEFMMNPELNALMQCGIEGEHYNLDENGLYVPTEEGTNNYPYESASTWNFRNYTIKLQDEGLKGLQELFDADAEKDNARSLYPQTNITAGFAEINDEYETDSIMVQSLLAQYIPQLMCGLSEDVEGDIAALRAALDASAEWKNCREQYMAQWTAYCEEYGFTTSR